MKGTSLLKREKYIVITRMSDTKVTDFFDGLILSINPSPITKEIKIAINNAYRECCIEIIMVCGSG